MRSGAPKYLSSKRGGGSLIIWLLVTVITASLLLNLTTFIAPVVRYYGKSMSPTLSGNQLLLLNKLHTPRQGDIIAFYYNNNVMVSRVIAEENQTISINVFGEVTVDGEKISEPYVTKPALGQTDLNFPYSVPSGTCFVMSDDREISMDSRLEKIGCVSAESVIGTAVFSLWPFAKSLDG